MAMLAKRERMTARRAEIDREIADLDAEITALAQAAAEHERTKALLRERRAAIVNKRPMNHTTEQRVKMSAHRASDDPLIAATNAINETVRGLVRRINAKFARRRIRTSPTQISLARRGLRPMRREVVAEIERLTGFEASYRNWPGGISDDQ